MHTPRIARILQCFGGGLRCASCGGIQGVCYTPAIIVKTKTMAFFITRRKTTSDVGKTMSDVEKIMSDVIQTTSDLFCYLQTFEKQIVTETVVYMGILLKYNNLRVLS